MKLIINIISMSKFKEWINRQLQKTKINPLWKLFLTGVKGQAPYNFYIKILQICGTIGFAYYFLRLRVNEIDNKGHNIIIPSYIYNVRQQNYIYWETVRIAKKMPTIFTYYQWDENLMFEIKRNGQQIPLQTHKGIENISTFNSPLHEYNFPASPERHSRIILYLKNLNNPYDLQNYLRWKPINIGDWLRAGYYFVYRQLGLTNRWRYDQYVSKPDIYYRWQKLRLAFRLSRDRKQLYNTMDNFVKQLTSENILTYLIWFL